ncbi:biopolymer transporter ExbD [Pontibacter qinzhouensis]|uniref:Biopolymer transporter ExbD n=1 Tax=Pontibacter qinzhouensis TaxID=2603253 RepID=A0A5C8KFI3_9BACT|nr:biopolymer transporter ExbD [Pontibacter qinzhouensis]TXK52636.1 biopolymer transporter ExbD [Pontibacter qinzhouensis]
MAQIQESSSPGRGGKRRSKKMQAHLDMTPMVDLAFLLLTFFMLTTTFQKLNRMQLQMPIPGGESPVKGENALTVVLGKNDKIHYYFGYPGDDPEVITTDFSAHGIRKVLTSGRVQQNEKLVVLLKASEHARYKNLVDILDEVNITATKRYALADLQPNEKEFLTTHIGG